MISFVEVFKNRQERQHILYADCKVHNLIPRQVTIPIALVQCTEVWQELTMALALSQQNGGVTLSSLTSLKALLASLPMPTEIE